MAGSIERVFWVLEHEAHLSTSRIVFAHGPFTRREAIRMCGALNADESRETWCAVERSLEASAMMTLKDGEGK